jgi:hypothetical protein
MTPPVRRSRAAAVAALAAALLPAAPARAYVRTTDPQTGAALSWALPAVPWHLNRDWPSTAPSCQAAAAGDPTLDAVRASFAEWEQDCADLRLLYAGEVAEIGTGTSGPGENVVVFRRGWCSQNAQAMSDPSRCMDDPDVDCGGIYGCFEDSKACANQASCAPDWSTVALTSVLYDPTTGRIIDADIEVNGWDGVAGQIVAQGASLPKHGWYFTCYPGTQPAATCSTYGQGSCAFMDLQNTVTHEVGHFVGLGHSPVAGSTMERSTQPREVSKRDLAADDQAGVCAIYPEPSGGCGCGGGAGAGAASLLVAALALRPRRSRRAA